jgi:hypothetical protein
MAKKQTASKAPAKAQEPPLRLEWRDPAELEDNPANWRKHPEQQLAAFKDLIAEVGFVVPMLYNEKTHRLIDGHGRKQVTAGQKVPVLIGKWTPAQEKKILATLDSIGTMASANKEALDKLLRDKDLQTGSAAIGGLLTELATAAQIIPRKTSAPPAGTIPEKKFEVIADCKDEEQQRELFEQLTEEGYQCRAVTL